MHHGEAAPQLVVGARPVLVVPLTQRHRAPIVPLPPANPHVMHRHPAGAGGGIPNNQEAGQVSDEVPLLGVVGGAEPRRPVPRPEPVVTLEHLGAGVLAELWAANDPRRFVSRLSLRELVTHNPAIVFGGFLPAGLAELRQPATVRAPIR